MPFSPINLDLTDKLDEKSWIHVEGCSRIEIRRDEFQARDRVQGLIGDDFGRMRAWLLKIPDGKGNLHHQVEKSQSFDLGPEPISGSKVIRFRIERCYSLVGIAADIEIHAKHGGMNIIIQRPPYIVIRWDLMPQVRVASEYSFCDSSTVL